MIDGIKIDLPKLNGNKWLDCPFLDFYTYTNTKTGELLDGTLIAKYRGLKFFITKSIKYPNKTYCSVQGSLHKYFNNGKHNANDFTIEDLQKVLDSLHKKFAVNPDTAILRNVEFGVNIHTPVTASELLKNLVCYGGNTFIALKIENVKVGKKIQQQRSDLKIYDKGRQYNLKAQNLTRIELAVKKMVFLKYLGITTLGDLVNLSKIKPLGGLLLSYWNGVIYYDKQVNWKQLTPFERKKLLYYATPRNWEDFDKKQRYRAKKHFTALMAKYSTSTTHKNISDLLAEKVGVLTAIKCPPFNRDLRPKLQRQNVHLLTVRIHSYNVDVFNPLKSGLKNNEKMTLKPHQETTPITAHFCKTCGVDISYKKESALYCSKRCNNSYHATQRKIKRHKIKKLETEKLNVLLATLNNCDFALLVEYRVKGAMYADTLFQNEINTSYNWIRKVTRVTVQAKPSIVFTSYRAKQLIFNINNQNKKHGSTCKS